MKSKEEEENESVTKRIIFSRSSWTGDRLVYGVFSTPSNALAGSAVCAFSLADIARAFGGEFKGQKNADSNWLPVKQSAGTGNDQYT